jgi:hypothetical protein
MYALLNNTTSNSNTASGYAALRDNTTGNNNTASGYEAGRSIANGNSNQTGNNSVFLGYDTRANADGEANQIVIGYEAVGLGSNTVVLGNSSINTTALRGNVGIGTTSPGANLHIEDSSSASIKVKDTSGAAAQIGAYSDDENDIALLTTQNSNARLDLTRSGAQTWGLEATGRSTIQYFDITDNGSTVLAIKKGGNIGIGYDDPGIGKLSINGNVGIGTTSPNNKLDVDGGIDANTLNTGQGDNELYAMNQNVRTIDKVAFKQVETSLLKT